MPPAQAPHETRQLRKSITKESPGRKPLSEDERQQLSKSIGESFGWSTGPKNFQMEAIVAQLERRDVLVNAGTGSGKTGIAAGPHVHSSIKQRTTIVVSPLLQLHDEQVSARIYFMLQ